MWLPKEEISTVSVISVSFVTLKSSTEAKNQNTKMHAKWNPELDSKNLKQTKQYPFSHNQLSMYSEARKKYIFFNVP